MNAITVDGILACFDKITAQPADIAWSSTISISDIAGKDAPIYNLLTYAGNFGVYRRKRSFVLVEWGASRIDLYEPIDGVSGGMQRTKVYVKTGFGMGTGMHTLNRQGRPARVSTAEVRDALAAAGFREMFKVFKIRSNPVSDMHIKIVWVVGAVPTDTQSVVIPALRVVEWGLCQQDAGPPSFYVTGKAAADVLRAIIKAGGAPADATRADIHDAVSILKHLGAGIEYYV